MNLSRRGFIKLTGATLAASSLDALGFGLSSEALAALVRPFKLVSKEQSLRSIGKKGKRSTSGSIYRNQISGNAGIWGIF
jgi:hypothetical protein